MNGDSGRRRASRYVLVGIYNTAVGYAIFVALFWLLESWAHYLPIAVASHVVSVTHSFIMHRRFVFRSQADWLPELVRFHISSIAVFLFSAAILVLLVEGAGLGPLPAQAVALAVSVAASYFLHLGYSFQERDTEGNRERKPF